MSRKNVLQGDLLASAQSLGASFNSTAINIENMDIVTWNVFCTSVTDNTGTFKAQIRVKKGGGDVYSAWADLPFDPVPTLANAAATFTCQLRYPNATQARLVYTVGGSVPDGSAEIWATAQQVGS